MWYPSHNSHQKNQSMQCQPKATLPLLTTCKLYRIVIWLLSGVDLKGTSHSSKGTEGTRKLAPKSKPANPAVTFFKHKSSQQQVVLYYFFAKEEAKEEIIELGVQQLSNGEVMLQSCINISNRHCL
jgi:hypothetical protein